ncbi:MAG TPA: hypothetical protein VFV24_02780 [Candidatus Eisenbacteria bacterium]|nr:hypothetical protein [Candidatus Eisenbacteria bacterium]
MAAHVIAVRLACGGSQDHRRVVADGNTFGLRMGAGHGRDEEEMREYEQDRKDAKLSFPRALHGRFPQVAIHSTRKGRSAFQEFATHTEPTGD